MLSTVDEVAWQATFPDLRGLADTQLYDPNSYAAGQTLARKLRADGSSGIVYDSVRDAGAECVAAFRPRVIAPARQERHLAYHWNGVEIDYVSEIRAP